MRKVQQKLSVARGERPAELLFKNARVVNVFSGEIHETNVAVEDGRESLASGITKRARSSICGARISPRV
jgi:adenine deaminase